jgi:hypothetical protein
MASANPVPAAATAAAIGMSEPFARKSCCNSMIHHNSKTVTEEYMIRLSSGQLMQFLAERSPTPLDPATMTAIRGVLDATPGEIQIIQTKQGMPVPPLPPPPPLSALSAAPLAPSTTSSATLSTAPVPAPAAPRLTAPHEPLSTVAAEHAPHTSSRCEPHQSRGLTSNREPSPSHRPNLKRERESEREPSPSHRMIKKPRASTHKPSTFMNNVNLDGYSPVITSSTASFTGYSSSKVSKLGRRYTRPRPFVKSCGRSNHGPPQSLTQSFFFPSSHPLFKEWYNRNEEDKDSQPKAKGLFYESDSDSNDTVCETINKDTVVAKAVSDPKSKVVRDRAEEVDVKTAVGEGPTDARKYGISATGSKPDINALDWNISSAHPFYAPVSKEFNSSASAPKRVVYDSKYKAKQAAAAATVAKVQAWIDSTFTIGTIEPQMGSSSKTLSPANTYSPYAAADRTPATNGTRTRRAPQPNAFSSTYLAPLYTLANGASPFALVGQAAETGTRTGCATPAFTNTHSAAHTTQTNSQHSTAFMSPAVPPHNPSRKRVRDADDVTGEATSTEQRPTKSTKRRIQFP